MTLQIFLGNALGILAIATLVWLYSVRIRDASIVDPWWSMLFLWVVWHTALRTGLTPGKVLLLGLVTAWALRLFIHLSLRRRGHPEDPRYAAFRQRFGPERYWWFSFFQVFLLQGTLALIISAPLQVAASAPALDPLSPLDIAGAAVFATGFGLEAIADAQLQRFRDDPSCRGKVLDTGLWAWSRHPNYFGEAVLWWGLWLCAADQPGGWATALAPALMTFLLVRVSGVAMLDDLLRKTKPQYASYVQRVPAFIPRRPGR